MRTAARSGAVAGALAAVAVTGTVALAAVRSGEALPGTSVAGVDVGGLGRAQVLDRVREVAQARTTGPLLVTAGERRVPVDRAPLVGPLDLQELADAALSAGRSGSLLGPLLGPLLSDERDVVLPLQVDDEALDARVRSLAAGLYRPVQPGDVVVEGTQVRVELPAPGRALRSAAAREALRDALRQGRRGPVALPLRTEAPAVTAAEVQRVAQQARQVLAEPYRLTAGEQTLTLAPRQVGEALRTTRSGRALDLVLDREVLAETVSGLASPITRAPRDARFDAPGRPVTLTDKGDLVWRPRPVEVRVVPGRDGRGVDVGAVLDEVERLLRAGGHEGALPLRTTPPAVTTEQLSRAGVKDLIGTFTTSFAAGQPRVTNIRRVAEIVDGTLVGPGEVFSLNGTAGRRTRARGFVADGAIVDGELEDQVGGGISQFATTLFNAAFFAGLPIPAHKPHSFYISRYPAGRESTVDFGTIDVRFRNDTASSVLVRTASTGTTVTVSLYGDNGGRRVQATTTRRERTADGGLATTVVRTTTGGDGEGGRRVFRWTYDPPPEEG